VATENYAGTAMAKMGLAALGKMSAATFALTLGTAVVAVVVGAVLAAQMTDFRTWELEASDKKNPNADQR